MVNIKYDIDIKGNMEKKFESLYDDTHEIMDMESQYRKMKSL